MGHILCPLKRVVLFVDLFILECFFLLSLEELPIARSHFNEFNIRLQLCLFRTCRGWRHVIGLASSLLRNRHEITVRVPAQSSKDEYAAHNNNNVKDDQRGSFACRAFPFLNLSTSYFDGAYLGSCVSEMESVFTWSGAGCEARPVGRLLWSSRKYWPRDSAGRL